MPRDPVTGTPAIASEEEARTPASRKDSSALEQDIRRTRADLSETVDEIERRLSPDRLKQEAKHTVQETIDEVRDRYNPQRLAEQAGRTMLDTVKDHPVPAMIAGLSIGYLFMKAGEGNGHKRPYYERQRYDYPRRAAYGDVYFEDDYYGGYREPRGYERYEQGYPTDAYYTGGAYERSASDEDEHPSMKERASEKASEAKHRASDFADEAQHRARQARRQVRYGVRRAESGFDTFIHENPLAAGAIALGVGAFLGGLLPSTEKEDEWMGEMRDDVVHRAEDAAEKTMEQAKQAAGRVSDEAKSAAQEVKETTKQEAQRVKETAQSGASDMKQEARHQAQEKSKETSR